MRDEGKTKRQLLSELNELRQFIQCSRDISDRKATEEKLRKSEEKYRAIFDNAVEGIFQTTIDGRFLSANPALAHIFGYDSPADLMSSITNISKQLYARQEDREENLRLINENGVLKGFEAQGCRKDGSTCWISINTRLVKNDGDPMYYEGFIEDITERKHAEEAVVENEALFRSLVHYMHDAMIILDWDGSILFANRGAARTIGYERAEELLGHNMVEYIHSDSLQKAAEDIISVKAGKMGFLSEYQLNSVTGRRIWVESIGGKIIFHGDYANLVCIRDITDRKQAEADKEKLAAQNRQIQKAESLGRMAGAIAHTFNNYLGVVIGNMELAMDDLTQGAGLINRLTAAMQAAGKATEVSDLMLTYLGHSFDKVELLDLSEACRQNLPILQAMIPGKVTLESDLPSPGPAVMANKNQIQQILANLLTNAWEAVDDDRGSIHLNIKTLSPSDIHTTHRYPTDWQPQDAAYACLEVIDTGVGITDRDKENLFDPFFTSKFIGRGMGLPVVMGIVQTHGGAITVESEPGRGSTFRVFLPVYAEKNALPNENAGSGGDTLVNQVSPMKMEMSGTILLIEDEEMMRNMSAAMLKRLGFSVLEAKDGVEGVDIFRQHQDEIRCVLSDLTMPRMNGWETLTALRKLAPDIPVILASGYDEAHVMAGDHTEWPQAFLGKPYKLKGLSEAIGQALVSRK